MYARYLLEDRSGYYLLENFKGYYLLENSESDVNEDSRSEFVRRDVLASAGGVAIKSGMGVVRFRSSSEAGVKPLYASLAVGEVSVRLSSSAPAYAPVPEEDASTASVTVQISSTTSVLGFEMGVALAPVSVAGVAASLPDGVNTAMRVGVSSVAIGPDTVRARIEMEDELLVLGLL